MAEAEEDCTVPPSIWQRLDNAARNPRATLTHRGIADAAVALADAEGLEAVSMRKLAERLGVATMALYRYVNTKDELLELMIDAIVDPDVLTADPADWRAVFREVAMRRRQSTLAHPWLPEAQALVPHFLTPARNTVVERMLASLQGLDMTADEKMIVVRTVDAFARGASDGEVNQRRMLERRGFGADGDIRRLLSSNMAWMMRSGRYPVFAKTVAEGLREPDAAAEFELGLDCMLDGLAARFGI